MGVDRKSSASIFGVGLDAILFQFGIQLISGLVLSLPYRATSAQAHSSTVALHSGPLRLVQALHYWSSALLISESVLLLGFAVWKSLYRNELRRRYLAALLLVPCVIGFQVSGNLLPFDKHGVETAAIEAGIAARAPFVGSEARLILLHGAGLSGSTLSLWYYAHWGLTFLALAIFCLAFYGRQPGQRVPGAGKIITSFVALPFVVALLIPSPLGSAATPADYGSFDARASWYTWPLHGSLVMFDRLHLGLGWIGATLIPAIGLIVLAALPWIESRLPKFFARYVLGCLCLLYGVAALGFGGSFAPLTGTRDPVVAVEPKVRQAAPINAYLATQGKALFATSGCADCHGSDGLKGGAGPSLKNIWKTNPDPEFYERYIHAPTSVDPQSTMPPFGNLNNQELAAIAEFLRAPR